MNNHRCRVGALKEVNTQITQFWILMVVAFSLAAMLVGCSPSSTGGNNAAQAYAGTAELMLQAINSNDYARFSADFNGQMKQSLTEVTFHELTTTVRNKIGTYVASRVYGLQEQSSYTVVTYKAKFTDEPDEVTVTIKFQKMGGKSLVSDFNLGSPKLQAK
jgi:hypothetical protein